MTTSAPLSVPKRFEEAEFARLPEVIRTAIENIRKTRRGLYLWGPVGSGKTYALHAMRKRIHEMGITVRLHSAPEMFEMIRDDYDHKDSFNFERIMANRGVLMIDDIGAEKPSEWVAEKLFMIVNKRYEEVLPTIFTSNFPLGELSEIYGDRIPSRITEMCDVVKLDGEDRRMKKRA